MLKYTKIEEILEIKSSKTRLPYEWDAPENSNLAKFAALDKGKESDGYLYVRCRAISSRVNKNNDGWPSEELSKAYSSFIGRPVFVDHNNDDPKRTRGVIVDSKLHVDDDEKTASLDPYYSTAPDNHKPPTWIELLIEVDGKTFPKLADAIRNEDIDAVSMGANIKQSVCSVCANEATIPDEFCDHIKKKGLTFEVTSADGEVTRKKAYEDCVGIDFFEISFVFDPADETALISEKRGSKHSVYGTADDPRGVPLEVQANMEKHSPGKEHMKGVSPKRNRQYEHILESCKEEHPDWDEDRCKEYAARTVNKQRAEKGETKDSRSLEDMLGKHLAMDRIASLKKEAYPNAEMFVEPVGADHGKGGDPNFVPQADKVTAPEEVNTLRNENLCPVCRASVMETGRDGVLECPTCGHVAEPEPLNNPDLSLSQDKDLQDDNAEAAEVAQQAPEESANQITFTPSVARKQKDTEGVISEMFETILTTKSKEIVDQILPVAKIGRVETTLGSRLPISNRTYRALKEAGLLEKVSVEYPAIEKKVKLSETAPIINLFMTEESAMKLKKTMDEVPLVIEASTQEEAEEAVKIILAASEQKTAATQKPKSNNTILPPGKVISDEPKSEKVISDQLAPVESAVTINIGDSTDATETVDAVEEPAEETVVEAEDTSVEDVVADVEEAEETAGEEVVESEDKEAKLLTAFRLADLSVEMGLVEPANKMVFIAELEEETIEQLNSREKTLAAVKTAGLKKSSSRLPSLQRIPRLSHTGVSVGSLNLEAPDEALFL